MTRVPIKYTITVLTTRMSYKNNEHKLREIEDSFEGVWGMGEERWLRCVSMFELALTPFYHRWLETRYHRTRAQLRSKSIQTSRFHSLLVVIRFNTTPNSPRSFSRYCSSSYSSNSRSSSAYSLFVHSSSHPSSNSDPPSPLTAATSLIVGIFRESALGSFADLWKGFYSSYKNGFSICSKQRNYHEPGKAK